MQSNRALEDFFEIVPLLLGVEVDDNWFKLEWESLKVYIELTACKLLTDDSHAEGVSIVLFAQDDFSLGQVWLVSSNDKRRQDRLLVPAIDTLEGHLLVSAGLAQFVDSCLGLSRTVVRTLG